MADPLSIQTWRNMFTKHGSKFGWGLAVVFALPLVVGFGLNQFQGSAGRNQQRPERNQPVLSVNGETVPMSLYENAMQSAKGQPGEQVALTRGQIIDQIIESVVIKQEAKKRNARVNDEDVEKTLVQQKEAILGKDASEADFRKYVVETTGKTYNEYRDSLSEQLLGQALFKQFQDEEKVTEQDAKNQSAEVKFNIVLLATEAPQFAPPGAKKPPVLSDADAKKKADELLAQAKAGGDIAAIAKANSSDMTAKTGGLMDFRNEFMSNPGMDEFGSLGYGKEFDEAVRKAKNGEFTEVVKTTGIMKGYAFAKVLDRRNNLPKDFDAKKVTESMKQQRAGGKIQKFIQDQVKAAKVAILDPDAKAYYDYFKLQPPMMNPMMGMTPPALPDKATQEKKKTEVLTEFEGLQKRNPKDATVALVLASLLKEKMFTPSVPAAERDAMRDRLISLYETALESTEKQDLRFELAGYYRDKKQNDLAEKQYSMISRLLNASPPYDAKTADAAMKTRMQLRGGFDSIGKADEVKKQQDEIEKTRLQMAQFQMKEMLERQKQEAEQRKQTEALKNATKESAPGVKIEKSGPPPGAVPGGTVPKPDAGTPPPPK